MRTDGFFPWRDVQVKWFLKSPINRAAYCEAERCVGPTRRVERDERRLCIDNEKGKKRKKSHGKRNQWVCLYCARQAGVPREPPIPPEPMDQGDLFN